MKSKRFVVGVDIGGTKISVVLATLKGRILLKKIIPTQLRNRARQSVEEIGGVISFFLRDQKLSARQLAGIGIGIPGPVDPVLQKIDFSPNLPGWQGIPLKAILQKKFHCPVFLENDANVAALGEKYFGAGRGVQNFIYMTVSTGIGTGIVANEKLIQGASGAAGEVGHMTICIGGERCNCGKRGCLEAYASGTAIGKFATREIQEGKQSILKKISRDLKSVTSEEVSKAAAMGDLLSIQIRERAADFLGAGLGNVINIFNPELIILGGGVMTDARHFLAPMMRSVKREAWLNPYKHCKIVRTKLGAKVGDLGTVAVVLERKTEK